MAEKLKTDDIQAEGPSKWNILMHNSKEEAERHADTLSEIQHSFVKRVDSLKESSDEMSEKEFLKWEDEYVDEYRKMMKEVNMEGMNFDDTAKSIVKMVAYPGGGQEEKLAKTIEAQSGNYYYERVRDLRSAIDNANLSDEEAKKEKNLFDEFVGAVYDHIDFKYMDREDVMDYGSERYENDRTYKHNNVIELLNQINDLARKYKTRPLTPRNFWPSNLKEKRRQTPEQSTIFRYDRDIVEEYYALAFPQAVKKAAAAQQRKNRYGIY